jgi:hypothetical protein
MPKEGLRRPFAGPAILRKNQAAKPFLSSWNYPAAGTFYLEFPAFLAPGDKKWGTGFFSFDSVENLLLIIGACVNAEREA